MASQQILCCGSRMWTLVIGWVQTISNAIFLGGSTLGLMVLIHNHFQSESIGTNDEEDEEAEREMQSQEAIHVLLCSFLIFLIVISTIGLISGVMLILSVKQENARKLKIWIIIQFVLLAVPIVSILATVFLAVGYGEIVAEVILWAVLITLNVLSIWVVSVHRKEILSVGESRVRYVSRI